MVDETVYKEEKTAQSALIGAYTRLCVLLSGAPNDQNNYTNSSFAFQLADIGTENITVNDGASSLLAMENANIPPTNTTVLSRTFTNTATMPSIMPTTSSRE